MESSLQQGKHSVTRVVQLSDCHLGADQGFMLAGINTFHSFTQSLSEIEGSQKKPSLIAVTGDIASAGNQQTYQLFSSAMSSSQLPYAWLPGNHDDFSLMKTSALQPFSRVVELEGWVAIFLVSAVPGEVYGEISDAELTELDELLKQYEDRSIVLFVHHPPVPVGCKWLDQQCIANSEQFGDLIAQHENIRAIFTGHVHQENESIWQGLPVYSAPSTCFQFARGSDTFELSELPPGYRWIDLYPDGRIETGVERLNYDMKTIDRSCLGY
jgi:Icc protein